MRLEINIALFVSLLVPTGFIEPAGHSATLNPPLIRVEVKHQYSDWLEEPSPYNPCPSEVELPTGPEACLGGGQ
jgi:hypothetical protein